MARKAMRRLTPEEQAGKKKRLILLGCAGAVALGLIVLLCVYGALHAGPALPRSVQKRAEEVAAAGAEAAGGSAGQPGAPGAAVLSPAASAAIPQGTPPLKQQLAQMQYAGQTGDTRPQTLYVSDSELNSMIAESFKADENLKSVRAYFGTGKAYIVGAVSWKGQNLNLTVTAEPVIVNGGLQFTIESVNVGSMAAPPAVRDRIQSQANKGNSKLDPARTGLYVDRVDIRDGVAILSGTPVRKTQ